jgi:hypothetical protein
MFSESRLVYFDLLRKPRFEDYKMEYLSSNAFEFMGNGFSTIDFTASRLSHPSRHQRHGGDSANEYQVEMEQGPVAVMRSRILQHPVTRSTLRSGDVYP